MRQVAGPIETAVMVTIMSSAALDPNGYGVQGLIHGANVTFLIAAIMAATDIIGSFLLKHSHGDVSKPVQARYPTWMGSIDAKIISLPLWVLTPATSTKANGYLAHKTAGSHSATYFQPGDPGVQVAKIRRKFRA